MFSWECAVSGEDIMNEYSDNGATPCVLVCPDDSIIEEDNYNGYGIFGGRDAYALLSEWNDPELHDDPVMEDGANDGERRDKGISIAFGDKPVEYPLKFVLKKHYTGQTYADLATSGIADGQGMWTSEAKQEIIKSLSGGD